MVEHNSDTPGGSEAGSAIGTQLCEPGRFPPVSTGCSIASWPPSIATRIRRSTQRDSVDHVADQKLAMRRSASRTQQWHSASTVNPPQTMVRSPTRPGSQLPSPRPPPVGAPQIAAQTRHHWSSRRHEKPAPGHLDHSTTDTSWQPQTFTPTQRPRTPTPFAAPKFDGAGIISDLFGNHTGQRGDARPAGSSRWCQRTWQARTRHQPRRLPRRRW